MLPHWLEDTTRGWRHRRFVRRHLAERRPGIRDALCTASEACVLLTGNSHAEFLGTPDFGGRPCLNLGVGGSTAADCATHLASLHAPIHSAAAVLFIGTNDILRWRHPERPRAACRFETEVRRILRTLETWSEEVFVAAVPPVGAWATSRDPAAVATFSGRLEALCAEAGHTFFDPFVAMRDGGSGITRSGLHRDGVHMADYPRLAAEVVRVVVPKAPARVRMPRAAAATPIPIEGAPHAAFCASGRPFSMHRTQA